VLEKLAIWLAYVAIRLVGASLRYRVEGAERLEQAVARGHGVIVYSWHEGLLMGAWYMSRRRPTIMISLSRDGGRIARIVERLGWTVVRGSSSRRGVAGTLGLLHRIKRGDLTVHLVDGPRGPARQVKPGLVLMGQLSGAPIVPAALSARWGLRTGSWDRMWIPLPFSRLHICFGEPEQVPRDLPEPEAEQLRKRIERDLERAHERLREASAR
jgi:lysophospholipid acyltransferase (LPLAT)-like uncharacterized protein